MKVCSAGSSSNGAISSACSTRKGSSASRSLSRGCASAQSSTPMIGTLPDPAPATDTIVPLHLHKPPQLCDGSEPSRPTTSWLSEESQADRSRNKYAHRPPESIQKTRSDKDAARRTGLSVPEGQLVTAGSACQLGRDVEGHDGLIFRCPWPPPRCPVAPEGDPGPVHLVGEVHRRGFSGHGHRKIRPS